MTRNSLDHATVSIDQAAAYALEQMALTEGCSVAAVLQAAIGARWQAHREAEVRRRETASRDAGQYGNSGDPGDPPGPRAPENTALRVVGNRSSQ